MLQEKVGYENRNGLSPEKLNETRKKATEKSAKYCQERLDGYQIIEKSLKETGKMERFMYRTIHGRQSLCDDVK